MNYTVENVQAALEAIGVVVINRDQDNLSINCPFCPAGDPDTKAKCYITPGKWNGIYRCFRCDTAGIIKSLYRKLGIPVTDSTESLGQKAERIAKMRTVAAFKQQNQIQELEITPLPVEYEPLDPSRCGHLHKRAVKFLQEKRGVHWDQILDWQLGICPSGRFAHHIIMPVFSMAGQIQTFQARRFIGTINPKSKNPKADRHQISKADVLYGLQKLKPGDSVILVEGPFDVLHIERCFSKAHLRTIKPIGLLGHKISRIQTHTLRMYNPPRAWVMMDSDAVKDSYKIGKMLARVLEGTVYVCELEKGDPDDLSPVRLLKKIQNGVRIRPFQGSVKTPSLDAVKYNQIGSSAELRQTGPIEG